ncbi:MAG: hypothetical protein AAFQ64_02080 [Pseudomonadota bacterium]
MADIVELQSEKRPFVRVMLDYVLASFVAFFAFLVFKMAMVAVTNAVLGAPVSHHAEMLYLTIAAVSVAFADPVGALQQRDGWQGHILGAGATMLIGFLAAFAYVAMRGH